MNLSNFASLFPFRSLIPQPSINAMLDSSTVTLERLMDEDSFSTEFKSQNPKLMELYTFLLFSLNYDKYKTLVEYLVVVGPE